MGLGWYINIQTHRSTTPMNCKASQITEHLWRSRREKIAFRQLHNSYTEYGTTHTGEHLHTRTRRCLSVARTVWKLKGVARERPSASSQQRQENTCSCLYDNTLDELVEILNKRSKVHCRHPSN